MPIPVDTKTPPLTVKLNLVSKNLKTTKATIISNPQFNRPKLLILAPSLIVNKPIAKIKMLISITAINGYMYRYNCFKPDTKFHAPASYNYGPACRAGKRGRRDYAAGTAAGRSNSRPPVSAAAMRTAGDRRRLRRRHECHRGFAALLRHWWQPCRLSPVAGQRQPRRLRRW